eukprot:m.32632 g.32632  ORF g.32632 m.32632 type:complete len:417 (-) comp9799_c0_seq1:139-1389(-)
MLSRPPPLPSQHAPPLTSVVAERIVSVIDVFITKCKILPILDESLLPSVDDSAFTNLLSSHLHLKRSYEQALEYENEDETTTLYEELAESTRNVIYHITKHPALQTQLLAIANKRNGHNNSTTQNNNNNNSKYGYASGYGYDEDEEEEEEEDGEQTYSVFVEYLSHLRHYLYLRLATSVEDQRMQQEKVRKLRALEKRHIAHAKALETKLQVVNMEYAEEMAKRDEIVEALEADLDVISHTAEQQNRLIMKESKMKEKHHKDTEANLKAQLTRRIAKLKEDLEGVQNSNMEMESKLRKRKIKLQSQISSWVMKYDQDMTEKQKEYDGIKSQYDKESEQLQKLNDTFNEIEVEYNTIMEERRMERERKKAAEEELQKMIRATLVIQTAWKKYIEKKKASKKSAKGKKGKKSAKKKKK